MKNLPTLLLWMALVGGVPLAYHYYLESTAPRAAQPPPAIPLPKRLGEWEWVRAAPPEAATWLDFAASAMAGGEYVRSGGAPVTLLCGWLRASSAQTDPETDMVRIGLGPGGKQIDANRAAVTIQGKPALLLWWYENRGRATPSAFAAHTWAASDRLQKRPERSAVLRVLVRDAADPLDATTLAAGFVREFMAQPRQWLE